MGQVINLTPHAIRVVDAEGQLLMELPPSGVVARVETSAAEVGRIGDIPVLRTDFGAVTGVPAPEEGVVYITSTLVAQAARRPDVVSPDTGPTAVRENGQVVAVRRFQTF